MAGIVTQLDANGIIRRLTLKNKQFRVIETYPTEHGVNIVFVDLPTVSMSTIADWIYAAGGTPMYVGREQRGGGHVMVSEIR
jgi:hypothetical protein